MKVWVTILLLISGDGWTREISELLAKVENLPAEQYIVEIDILRGQITDYIDNKKKVCAGVFSTLIISPDSSNKTLSKGDKNICLSELKKVQIQFVESQFSARVRYLNFLHLQRVEELEKNKVKVLKNLN